LAELFVLLRDGRVERQVLGRDDLVGIDVVAQDVRFAADGRLHGVLVCQTFESKPGFGQFGFKRRCLACRSQPRYSRGSVISPRTALAATVSGLARYTRASLWPMRPGKLRLVVLMQLSGWLSRPKVSLGPPRQAAHDGGPSLAPAARNTSSRVWPFSFS